MRIGITMRKAENPEYSEVRDSLSRDWSVYLANLFPDAVVVPLLNQPQQVTSVIEKLDIDRIVLSNGSSWGDDELRDQTEQNITQYCLERDIPILGVCRGFQVLNVALGGALEKDISLATGEGHINVTHKVCLCGENIERKEVMTNSYHQQGLLQEGVSSDVYVFASTEGGVVEGFYHKEKPVMAVQWHPERKNPGADFDRWLITCFFNQGMFWRN